MTRRVARLLVLALTIAGTIPLAFVVSSPPAAAVSASLWDPGFIISDQVFYDGSAMNASEVQAFLNQKVPTCQNGYTCLKDYHQATPTIAADAYCSGYVGAADETAATIIAKVGQSCNISQKALLVTMQKEMSLVTLTAPSQWRFDKAMGFACPDGAVCDPAYSGFFYQVFYAARQFQRYAAHPTSFNYQAGRYNNILYSPNTACGFSSVYIANRATAGLYNYTPYQPNEAALLNLYGTGDGCSAYGNRNFFRYYWDWFGSPVTSNSLLRTYEDPTVYLVSGMTKYPILEYQTLLDLSPLGAVGYVTQAYLNGYTTGPNVGRNFRNEEGIISLFDQAHLLAYATCDMMIDFGYSCAPDQYVQLTNNQYEVFAEGPALTNVIGTPAGGRYRIEDGTKSEILDEASQAAAGLPESMVVLSEAAIGHLPYGVPIIRNEVIVGDRDRGSYSLLDRGELTPISASIAKTIGASTRTAGSLDAESIDQIPTSGLPFDGIVTDDSGAHFLLIASGRLEVMGGGLAPSASPPFPASLLELWSDQGTLAIGSFIKSATEDTLSIITENELRPISSWAAFLALSSTPNPPPYSTVPQTLLDRMMTGPVVLTTGALVRSEFDPEIYLINGLTNKVLVPDLLLAGEAGYYGVSFVPQDQLDAYPLNSEEMGYGYQCSDTRYVAAGGSLHKVSAEQEALYPLTYLALDEYTCARATVGLDAAFFIRIPDGTIYLLKGGQIRPLLNWGRWLEISDGAVWLDVQEGLTDLIPLGSSV